MNLRIWLVFTVFGSVLCSVSHAADAPSSPVLRLTAPLDYQVIQRFSKEKGTIVVSGEFSGMASLFEARLISDLKPGPWQVLKGDVKDRTFTSTLEAPAGGWHRLEVRATDSGKAVSEAAVEHVGIGEVFVVAGQSNSANHGEEKQATKTEKVVTFDGKRWQLCKDPQPGASGGGGSFMPPFGDAMATRLGVPIGFVACGIGATSVREWLPPGITFPNPPTLVGRVSQRPDGQWNSNGKAFNTLVARTKSMGPQGVRAILWHQGESDANQKDPTRTLSGKLYRQYMEQLIADSRKEIGWEVPWFVAQVSYHVPNDEASPDIREAQASLWKDRIALEGPDSDAIKGELRERKGRGVHFSGPGLREHAAKWAEKVGPWLEQTLNRQAIKG